MGERLSRRSFVQAGAVAAAGLAAGRVSLQGAAAAPERRPNLVFVFPDEFRAAAMGWTGEDPVLTPNLDRFARESVRFTNAVSNYPVCSPYRAMLFTGRWPFSTGVTTNCNSGRPEVFLKPEERCLSDVLAESGYACGYLGKWHLDAPTEEDARYGEGRRGDGRVWDTYTPPGPRRHGFTFWHAYGCCDRHLKPHYWVGDAPVSRPTQVDGWSVRHETDVAVDFILNRDGKTRDPGKPFALFVAHNPPHMPFDQVPEEYRARYAGKTPEQLLNRPNLAADSWGDAARRSVANYFAAVTGIDEQFGRILKALEDAGLSEDTLVIFTSDHGEMMGSHGRMGKGVCYEESFRIPLLMRYPRRLRPGADGLHLNVPDMMPTLLGLVGLRERIPPQVEGTDYSRQVMSRGGERPTSTFFVVSGGDPEGGQRGIRTDRHTLVVSRIAGDGKVLLFDRQEDPYQRRSVAEERPEVCRQLVGDLNAWLKRTRDPWTPVEWPIRPRNAFPVRKSAGGFRVDFEEGGGDGLMAGPTSPLAALTSAAEEVLSGKRSLKCDTRESTARFHEFLRLGELLEPGREYEVTYRYRVLASNEKTQFYTVVRSTADIDRKAVRLYWNEPPGEARTRSFRFKTEDVKDHHLLFGVEYQGALVIDDLVVKRVTEG